MKVETPTTFKPPLSILTSSLKVDIPATTKSKVDTWSVAAIPVKFAPDPSKEVAVITPALPSWIAVPTWISLSASIDGYALNVATPATTSSSKSDWPSTSIPALKSNAL